MAPGGGQQYPAAASGIGALCHWLPMPSRDSWGWAGASGRSILIAFCHWLPCAALYTSLTFIQHLKYEIQLKRGMSIMDRSTIGRYIHVYSLCMFIHIGTVVPAIKTTSYEGKKKTLEVHCIPSMRINSTSVSVTVYS